jgi:hypothetical protein
MMAGLGEFKFNSMEKSHLVAVAELELTLGSNPEH